MADQKISQLTDGTSFQAGDEAVVNRGGTNFKVDPTQFGSSIDVTGTVTADGLTVDGEVSVVKAAGYNQVHLGGDRTDTSRAGRIMKNWDAPYDMRIRSSSSVGDTPLYFETGSSGTRIQIASNGDISFYEDTGTTPKLFWDASAESLGIGTSSPSDELHISTSSSTPTVKVETTHPSGIPALELKGAGSSQIRYVDELGVTQTSINILDSGVITFVNSSSGSSVENMRIDSSGNVGIGTSSPNYPLTISNAGDGIKLEVTDTVDANFRVQVSGSNIITGPSTSSAYIFQTANTERMRITSAGLVGIGTASPTQALDVLGPSSSSTPFTWIRSTGLRGALYSDGGGAGIIQGSLAGAGIYMIENSKIDFRVNGSERMRLDASGNLLVGGTGTPTSSAGNFVLYNGTAPTGNATDGVILYAEDVSASSELKVRDEAGNVTTLSPHNFDLIPEGPSEDMAWSYYSERDGKRINVDMLKAIRLLEQISGEKLVHIV